MNGSRQRLAYIAVSSFAAVLLAEGAACFSLSLPGHFVIIGAGLVIGGLIGYGLYLMSDTSWMEWPDPDDSSEDEN